MRECAVIQPRPLCSRRFFSNRRSPSTLPCACLVSQPQHPPLVVLNLILPKIPKETKAELANTCRVRVGDAPIASSRGTSERDLHGMESGYSSSRTAVLLGSIAFLSQTCLHYSPSTAHAVDSRCLWKTSMI
jgi:hypothetical protein